MVGYFFKSPSRQSSSHGSSTIYAYDVADDFLEYVFTAASQEEPPLVQSISYGCDESEVPSVYAVLFEIEMLKVSLSLVDVGIIALLAGCPGGNRPGGLRRRRRPQSQHKKRNGLLRLQPILPVHLPVRYGGRSNIRS